MAKATSAQEKEFSKVKQLDVIRETMVSYEGEISECEFEEKHIPNQTRSYCDHSDPTKWYNPHSSMRYVRTTTRFNYIDMIEETLDWYICVFCSYETYFVH